MSPRIIHIPLSGGDRKAQAKGIRYAHGIHNSCYKESVLIRGAAKIREADRMECEAPAAGYGSPRGEIKGPALRGLRCWPPIEAALTHYKCFRRTRIRIF